MKVTRKSESTQHKVAIPKDLARELILRHLREEHGISVPEGHNMWISENSLEVVFVWSEYSEKELE